MRIKKSNGKISLNVISGTHVVLLGMDAGDEARKGLLGFAIRRTDHTENEKYWLQGFKCFKETEHMTPGKFVSTLEHPVQTFMWGDYTAKPEHKYTYEILPVYGRPKNISYGDGVEVMISTEAEDMETHAVYFNRGVAGSQAFVKKFGQQKELTPDALKWLSRGLEEAILAFIAQADSSEYALRASVYEFSYMPVLEAFKKASEKGADVKIIYDHRKPNPYETSDQCIEEAGIGHLMIQRTKGANYISHNKFIVLIKNGIPVQTWTGSTNFTKGGIFGQSNVGHLVRDQKTAQAYLDYWNKLAEDPEMDEMRKWNVKHTSMPDLENEDKDLIKAVFSPRITAGKCTSANPYALEWYANQMDNARMMVNFTAAFGVNRRLGEIFLEDKDYLRYLILDNKGQGHESVKITEEILKNPENKVAIGCYLKGKTPHGMVEEKLTNLNGHVKFLHTKYMILDALTDEPVIFSGSANFSDNSIQCNDENMLVIKGNTHVADIYLGEFMRLFSHYYFRSIYNRLSQAPGTDEYNSAFLEPDDSWTDKYYKEGSVHYMERLSLSGSGIALQKLHAEPHF